MDFAFSKFFIVHWLDLSISSTGINPLLLNWREDDKEKYIEHHDDISDTDVSMRHKVEDNGNKYFKEELYNTNEGW